MARMICVSSLAKKGYFIVVLFTVILLLTSCSMTHTNQIEGNISASESVCMNVSGSVLGKIKDNTTVTLYKAEGFDYKSTIGIINEGHPVGISKVSANQSFFFYCLPKGNYLLSVPTSSYYSSFGSPIPTESNQGDLKVVAILQGGDSQDWFSFFSIKRIS